MNRELSEKSQQLYDESNLLIQKYLDMVWSLPPWVYNSLIVISGILIVVLFIRASPKLKYKLFMNAFLPIMILFAFSYLPR